MSIPNPVRCVIDTDPGVDDVLAILLALASPELAIDGIVLTHGNTTVDNALKNLGKMFYVLERHLDEHPEEKPRWPGLDAELRASLGQGKIKVFLGGGGPLGGQVVTASYFHGRDGMSDLATNHPEFDVPYDIPANPDKSPFFVLQPPDTPRLDAFCEWVGAHSAGTLIYIALGPLTSLAILHQSVADTFLSPLHSLALILTMGGAVDVPGNTTPVSEFNLYADAIAAKTILDLALPHFHLFPLDITTAHAFPFHLYRSLVDMDFMAVAKGAEGTGAGKSPLVHFTTCLLNGVVTAVRRFEEDADAMSLHDPLVVWAAIDAAKARGAVPALSTAAAAPRFMFRRRSSATDHLEDMAARAASLHLEHEHSPTRILHPVQRSVIESVAGTAILESPLEDAEDTAATDDDYWNDGIKDGWMSKVVEFDVESQGSITRGMLVQDLRRSSAIQKRLGSVLRSDLGGVENTDGAGPVPLVKGTKVSIATPGADSLRMLLLNRIWDVKIGLV